MTEIKNITVVGAGVLGAQIAFIIAHAGFKVTAWDINDDAVEAARGRFDQIGKNMIADLDRPTEDSVAAAKENITLTTDLEESVSNADLIIEAVPEKLELKRSTWEKIGAAAPEHTIFATNTSSLLGSDIADSSGHPDRFLNMHFANRVWLFNIVEIMPNAKTDLKYRDIVEEFSHKADLEPVVLNKEQAGYVLNSLLIPFLKATEFLYANDVADVADIDKTWRVSTGAPMGPFEIMDMIGLRTVVNVAEASKEEVPDWQIKFNEIAKKMIEEGRSGAGDGEGFYKYNEDGSIKR